MIGSRNHFGGDRPIRAGQASPPGGTEGGERKEHVRSRLLKKGGHIFVQGRLLWWWGTTSVETSPLPRGPPPSCLNWPTGSFAPGRNHQEGQFPSLLRAQRRISRDTFPHAHHRTLPHSRWRSPRGQRSGRIRVSQITDVPIIGLSVVSSMYNIIGPEGAPASMISSSSGLREGTMISGLVYFVCFDNPIPNILPSVSSLIVSEG